MSEITKQHAVRDQLWRDVAGGPELMGSRCRACGELFFPRAAGCTRCCGSELECHVLGSSGTLWSWTVQAFLPKPPYDSGETEATFRPYGVGYVQMPEGIKVESRLTEADPRQLRIGMPMRLVLLPYRKLADGADVLTFAFAPEAEERRA
jgi:uncharacterized OB-fold protein